MANIPAFASTPVLGAVTMSAGNTNRNGSGALYTLIQAGANGSRVQWVNFQALTTTSAGTLRLFVNGNLLQEIQTAGATPSGTTPGENHTVYWSDPTILVLPPYAVLQAAVNNSNETWNVLCFSGNF